MTSPRILVVGSANVDLVTTVPRCPKAGETLIGSSFRTVPGGKGANQAVAAARLGAKTFFAGCVGIDAFGDMQHRTLSEDGIDLTYLKRHATEPTGTAVIFVAKTGQNSIVVIPAANYGLAPSDVDAIEPLLRDIDAVLLQLEIPLDTVAAVLDKADRHGVLSILDAGPAQKVPSEILRKASIVSPNETEAEAITGMPITSIEDPTDQAAAVANCLMDMGAREVVLKLGVNGALYRGKETVHVPAFTVNPIDTTAAGDAFTAALACAWKTNSPIEALRFANAAGALASMVAGAQPSMPKRAAVEAFLRERSAAL